MGRQLHVRSWTPQNNYPSRQLPGTWLNVTPTGLDLAAASNGGDNFGVADGWVHPLRPNVVYCLTNFNGMWWSTDWGQRWVKKTLDGGVLDRGKGWAGLMASDGSYMLAASGNNADGAIARSILRSTDGGRTWVAGAQYAGLVQPYAFAQHPTDPRNVLITNHENDDLHESTDGGLTMGAGVSTGTSAGCIVTWLDTTHCLVTPQDTGVSRRGTKSGGSWTFADSLTNPHPHGVQQAYRDEVNGFIFVAGKQGIHKSTDVGANWSQVFSGSELACVAASPSTLYCAYGFPSGGGTNNPNIQFGVRPAGTSYSGQSTPAGMTQGPKTIAVTFDGTNRIVLFFCHNAGIFRYVEPAP